jgi:hypothetical protein
MGRGRGVTYRAPAPRLSDEHARPLVERAGLPAMAWHDVLITGLSGHAA